jgi:hypothetical protein
VTPVPFTRLFAMPAFEGLRILRKHIAHRPERGLEEILKIVHRVEADSGSYDLEASCVLHAMVPEHAPIDGMGFYRDCVAAVLLQEMPAWAKLMTLGRGRFIKRLRDEEYRDITSIFRQAGLLDEPASDDDIVWWDDILGHVRLHGDREKLRMARAAEKLSLDHEKVRLVDLGIDSVPVWVAIDDNTVGYDVRSYDLVSGKLTPKLIEVKSTMASPLRFFLTRNEWEQALELGEDYHFHIWNMQKSPPALFERTVAEIAPHIPQDNAKGVWKTALIPVHIS